MPRLDIQIPAPDGTSPATLHVPDGDGPWPGVLLFPDAGGARETMREMADRLASMGYVALVPDIYYRSGDWEPFDMATLFSVPAERERLSTLAGVLTRDRVIADAGAYADFLLARPEVRGQAIGTTGYCLGGRMSLVAATGLGSKIGAAASFHGGRLAVADDPASPHLAVNRIAGTVYVAGATDDNSYTPEQAELLERALTDAGVNHTLEVYPAHHGFAVADNPTYDEQASARHWDALGQLYRTLG
jgi:carboxymethylenebutenolidase